MAIRTDAELGKALRDGQDSIEIEGDLKDKVIRIKATGNVAWAVAIGAIGVAVVAVIGTGGAATPVAGFVAAGAVSVLGVSATSAAIAIAVAAGGVGALNSLRTYKIVSLRDGKLLLTKK